VGSYQIQLVATDTSGASATATVVLEVRPQPVVVPIDGPVTLSPAPPAAPAPFTPVSPVILPTVQGSGQGAPSLPPVMLPVGLERSADAAPVPSRSVGGVWTSTGDIAQPSFVILGAGVAVDGLEVTRSVTNVSLAPAVGASFTLPAGLFRHSAADATLTVEARLSNGRPLPSWLSFDASTGRFSGKPPAGEEGVLSIRIKVRDGQGREAATDFKVEVRAGVWQPDLSQSDR